MKTGPANSRLLIFYSFLAFLFFLSLSPLVSTICLGISILAWLATGIYRDSFRAFARNKVWWLLLGFYLFHVVSLLWTENFKYAFFDLQIKLAYLVCPVVIAGLVFSENEWKGLRRAFITGTALAAVICFCMAIWNFAATGNKEMLFYDHFSLLMHPTYFMIYLNLSMLFILRELFWSREEDSRWRAIYSGILFFQLIVIFLLSARTSLATSMLTFLVYFFLLVKNKRITRKDAAPFVLFFGCAILFQAGILTYYNRYDQITKLIEQPGKNEENSTSIRYNLWKTAAEIIRENPVAGVGVGDIKEELVEKYTANHYEYGIRNRISPHNQYLHTAVILGSTGVLLLITMFLAGLVFAWRKKDWIYALFILIIAMNAVTESILERQAGILFFAFFNSLFAARIIGLEKTES